MLHYWGLYERLWGGKDMESAALLSPTDINVIRRYVHTKYAPLPGDRRAEIVADAIRRTLQQRLPNIPDHLKTRVTDQLISRCLLSEQRDVKPDDVIDLCAELEYDESDRGERLLEPILNWANKHSPGRWSPEQLASRLERRKVYGLALVPPLPQYSEQVTRDWSLKRWISDARYLIRRVYVPSPAWILLTIVVMSAMGVTILLDKPSDRQGSIVSDSPPSTVKAPEIILDIGMPDRLKYTSIDVAALKKYLKSRDSLLAEEPYFGAIVKSAKDFDIHPLLLFAITGQEQGFVPKSSKNAKLIANNPFNVGHSWMEYNTSIHKSARIAAGLIAELGLDRPEGHEPFSWFNKTYAEDPLWSEGVRKIFDQLNKLPSTSK
jgi:hypothetical protein